MRTASRVTILSLSILLSACVDMQDEATLDDDALGETSSTLVTTTSGPMVELEPAESTEDFLNPERGYYVGYDLLEGRDATSIRTGGRTLALAVVELDDYRSRSLDSAVLTALGNGFAKARAAGIKLIVRFSYNSSFSADASKSRILGHIAQLKPVLRANYDVIAVLQAGFIGAWGEWHSSTNNLDNPAARAEILAALLSAMPSTRSIQVRAPMYKDTYRPGALTEAEAYSGSSRSRIGHHNDCFLASASDMGTYASPVSTWLEYVAQDTRYVPMGGETCAVYTPKTTCAASVAEMERLHWSYLNRLYNQTVISNWVSQGCDSDIRRRLGYRFVLRRVAHSQRVAPGGVLDLEVDIRNRGFAVPFNERAVDVVLIRGSVRHVARLDLDARHLPAGLKTTVATQLRIPANLAPGTYTLALRLPDGSSRLASDPRYAIRFANTGVWDAATGDNVLTRSLVIDASAPGDRDASATRFVELP